MELMLVRQAGALHQYGLFGSGLKLPLGVIDSGRLNPSTLLHFQKTRSEPLVSNETHAGPQLGLCIIVVEIT